MGLGSSAKVEVEMDLIAVGFEGYCPQLLHGRGDSSPQSTGSTRRTGRSMEVLHAIKTIVHPVTRNNFEMMGQAIPAPLI